MMQAYRVVQEVILYAESELDAANKVQHAIDAAGYGDNTNISSEKSPQDPIV